MCASVLVNMGSLPQIGSCWAKDNFIYRLFRITSVDFDTEGIVSQLDAYRYLLRIISITRMVPLVPEVTRKWFRNATPACGICLVPCPDGLKLHESSVEHAVCLIHKL